MINPPKPDGEGEFQFVEKTGKGAKKLIDNYPISQTTANLNELIMAKYNQEKEKIEASGKSKAFAESAAQAMANKLSEFTAVQQWLDNEAEIKLKKALQGNMDKHKIPALIIRSVSLKAITSLNNLGLKMQGAGEIDLLMAYVSGDFLHVVICEVKRADTYPWQKSVRFQISRQ